MSVCLFHPVPPSPLAIPAILSQNVINKVAWCVLTAKNCIVEPLESMRGRKTKLHTLLGKGGKLYIKTHFSDLLPPQCRSSQAVVCVTS